MTKPRDLDVLLSAYLADGMTDLPDRVVEAVLGEAHRTRQRGMFGAWRTRSMLRAAAGMAVLVGVLVVGGALLFQRANLNVAAPSATPEASATPNQSAGPSEPAVVVTTPTPTAEVLSLDLTWQEVDIEGVEQVAWLGNQFVLVDGAGEVMTSVDGANWQKPQPGSDPGYRELLRDKIAVWQDDVVGWWNPQDPPRAVEHTNMPPVTARDILNILQPPAALIESTPFKGRIETIGVGPAGIVAQVHSHLDWDAWVTAKLGARSVNDWVTHLKSVEFVDGILDIELDDRPGLHVVWADEGFELGDYQDAGFGWYSADGTDWTQIPFAFDPWSDGSPRPLPTGFEAIVGVSDGFVAAGDGWMWHSADGLTWRKLGVAAGDSLAESDLVPWKGGALSTDGISRFELWTSEGSSELPMADEVPTPAEPYGTSVGTGPLGLVTMFHPRDEALLTRDGVDWKIQPTPPLPGAFSTIAVGDRSVLYLGWSGSIEEGGFVPHLWVGSLEP